MAPPTCPSDNTQAIEQERFWDGNWDAHKVGWLISGSAAAVTLFIALITIFGHAINYNRPTQQRQIIRILFFAPVFAIISFFSYRFFRSYTYYELVQVIYESIVIAAFMILMLAYIGDDSTTQMRLFATKDKRKLPLPFCCWRYRPSKAYFLTLTKWSVVQYCFVRPLLSIAGIVLEYYGLLCNDSLSYQYGHVYLLAIDFVSISVALYGLMVLYGLIKDDLHGKRPLAKFLTIKLGIFLVFYQSFVFSILQDHGVIKGTEYWTATNVSDGLNALATTLEMVIIACFQMWAFPWSEYKNTHSSDGESQSDEKSTRRRRHTKHTNPIWPLLHAIWLGDLAVEGWHSVRFAFDRMRGKEYTRQDARFNAVDIVAAFGVDRDREDVARPVPSISHPQRTTTEDSTFELTQTRFQRTQPHTAFQQNDDSPGQNEPVTLAPWTQHTLQQSPVISHQARLQAASARAEYDEDTAMQLAMFGGPSTTRRSRPETTSNVHSAPRHSESIYSNPSGVGTIDAATLRGDETTPPLRIQRSSAQQSQYSDRSHQQRQEFTHPSDHHQERDSMYDRPLSWEPQAM